MMQDDMGPIEIFERIAAEAIEVHLEPRLKAIRSEIRKIKKAQEIDAAERKGLRESLRQEFRAETDSLRRGYQTSIDNLTSQVAEQSVAIQELSRKVARGECRDVMLQVANVFPRHNADQEPIIRKYETAMVSIRHVDDPLEISSQFSQYCMAAAEKLGGVEIIRPGLQTPV